MAKSVSLFVTCLVDQLFPPVGLAMAEVLERIGYSIDFRQAQTCCGQPAFNSGHREPAREVACYFLDTFEDAEYIVVASASCCCMISHHYADLFGHDSKMMDRVHAMEAKTLEFSRFLLDVAKVDDVGARLNRVATYHDSCHALRELGIKKGPRQLLSKVQGLELREMEAAEECCGFGGTFSVKFAELSGAMANTKIESIRKTGADLVVSIDSSCLMQLEGTMRKQGIPINTMHLAEVLASQ
jgi:L-lactate dehydrogenase complex protein LldE